VSFPYADISVEEFPAADSGVERFPAADTGIEVFPPAPIPMIYATTLLVMTPVALVGAIPWRDAEPELTILPAAVMSVMVELQAVAVLEMSPSVSPVEEITAPADVAISPTAVVSVETSIGAAPILEMSTGIQGMPVSVVTADAITTLLVDASVAVAGIINSPAALAITPATTPTVHVAIPAAAALALNPATQQEVVIFLPSGMTKSGAYSATTAYTKVTGWAADPAYPGTVIVNNELIVVGESTNATLSASVQLDNTSGFNTRLYYIRLMRSGSATPVQAFEGVSITSSATPTVALSGTGLTLVNGERVWLEVRGNTAEIVVMNNPASYVRMFEP
jgi:hypothetical protein